jgi:hypothetical protein
MIACVNPLYNHFALDMAMSKLKRLMLQTVVLVALTGVAAHFVAPAEAVAGVPHLSLVEDEPEAGAPCSPVGKKVDRILCPSEYNCNGFKCTNGMPPCYGFAGYDGTRISYTCKAGTNGFPNYWEEAWGSTGCLESCSSAGGEEDEPVDNG